MWPCGWWITAGTRRIRAARRPTNPAFDVCVWTIDGRSCLISLSNCQSAARSSSGASSRPRDGTSTTRHPCRRASSSEGISDSRKDVASVQSYPARLSATHEAIVFSDEPPSVSRVIAWRTRTLTPALFVRTAPRRVRRGSDRPRARPAQPRPRTVEAGVRDAEGEQAARDEHAVCFSQDRERFVSLIDDVDQRHRIDRPVTERQQGAIGLDRRHRSTTTRDGARLARQVGADREPPSAAGERGQMATAAAHVEEPWWMLPAGVEGREPVEEHAEEASPPCGHPLGAEA